MGNSLSESLQKNRRSQRERFTQLSKSLLSPFCTIFNLRSAEEEKVRSAILEEMGVSGVDREFFAKVKRDAEEVPCETEEDFLVGLECV